MQGKNVFDIVVYQQVIFLVRSISVVVFHQHTSFLFQLCVQLFPAFRPLTCKGQFTVHQSEPLYSVYIFADPLTLTQTPNILNDLLM